MLVALRMLVWRARTLVSHGLSPLTTQLAFRSPACLEALGGETVLSDGLQGVSMTLLGNSSSAAGHQAVDLLTTFWDTVKPGGRLHPAWFLEHQGHLLMEGLLCVVIAVLLLQQAYKPSKRRDTALSEKARAPLLAAQAAPGS